MRVPSPAASTMVRLVLPVIPVLDHWPQGLRRRRHKVFEAEWKPGCFPSGDARNPAHFLLMFVA